MNLYTYMHTHQIMYACGQIHCGLQLWVPGTFIRHTGVGLEGGLRYEPKVAMADGFLSAVKKMGAPQSSPGLSILKRYKMVIHDDWMMKIAMYDP